MGFLRFLGGLFNVWYAPRRRFDRINSRGRAEESVSLGLTSIMISILSAALTVLFAWLGVYFQRQIGVSGALFVTILMIACIACAAVLFLRGTLFGGMFYWIYQLRMNRRAIGFVAIVVWILCLVASAVLSIYFLSAMGA